MADFNNPIFAQTQSDHARYVAAILRVAGPRRQKRLPGEDNDSL